MIQHKKYVIVEGAPIVFEPDLLHADVVCEKTKIDSAGFVTLWKHGDVMEIICSGESTSLSISSRPEFDAKLIAEHLKLS